MMRALAVVISLGVTIFVAGTVLTLMAPLP